MSRDTERGSCWLNFGPSSDPLTRTDSLAKPVPITRSSILFCFVGPGASGKSTICKQLLADDRRLFLSISTTTRDPRPGEVDGREYHFVSAEEFESRVVRGDFIEHAIFHNRRYGTEVSNIASSEQVEADLLLDIDLQGARAIKSKYRERAVVIFVFPPSGETLVSRLKQRGGDSAERMAERVKIARAEVEELRSPDLSDFLLINDGLSDSVAAAKAIITSERLRLARINPPSLLKLLEIPDY